MRVEANPLAISDRMPGQASDDTPVGDDQDLGPILQGNDGLSELLAASRELLLRFMGAPPFLLELGEAVVWPA